MNLKPSSTAASHASKNAGPKSKASPNIGRLQLDISLLALAKEAAEVAGAAHPDLADEPVAGVSEVHLRIWMGRVKLKAASEMGDHFFVFTWR